MKNVLPWSLLALASAPGAQDLLADLNTSFPDNPSSFLRGATEAAGLVYFSAQDGLNGDEPWVTDGTTAGTRLLADLAPNALSSSPSGFLALPGGPTVFRANPGGGIELFRTDGTPSGTALVVDANPTGNAVHTDPVLFAGEAWYLGDDGVHGLELWKSDGTAAGTMLVHEFFPGPAGSSSGIFPGRLAVAGGKLFVFAKNPASAGWGLYVSDGTSAGTQYLSAVTAAGLDEIEGFGELGGKLFFGAESPTFGEELWVSDGTVAGTFLIDVEPAGSSSPADFVTFGGHVYFAATRSDVGRELFRSDGTVAGTELFADIETQAGPFLDSSSPDLLGVGGGKLLAVATTWQAGRRLYASDGTVSGSIQLQVPVTFSQSALTGVPLGTSLVFAGGPSTVGDELWISDGTSAGTWQLTNVNPSTTPGYAGELASLGDRVVFRADDGVHGSEAWVTHGVQFGESLLADVAAPVTNLGSEPEHFLQVGRRVFFTAEEPQFGRELYVTDGTTAGTHLVKDIAPGPADFFGGPALEFDGRLLFVADDLVHGLEPWITDGTEAGTFMLGDLFEGPGASNWNLPGAAVVGGEVFFSALDDEVGFELFRTDGTPEGTTLAIDFQPGVGSGLPTSLAAFGDRLVFAARDASNQLDYHVFDPATGTVAALGNFNPTGDDARVNEAPVEIAAGLLLTIEDTTHGGELWLDDGSGPKLVVDLIPGSVGAEPHEIVAFGDGALFATGALFGATKLWYTDGTASGTVELLSNEGFLRSEWAVCRDVAYVWVVDVVGRDSLVVTDGTPAGTQVLLSTTFQSSFLTRLEPVGSSNSVVFQNYDPVTGIEAWVSDGTVLGTAKFADAWPGISSTFPQEFHRAGDQMVCSGWAQNVGNELLAIDVHELGGFVSETYGEGCEGSSGVVPTISTVGDPSATSPFVVRVEGVPASALVLGYYGEAPANVVFGGCTLHVPLSIAPNVFFADAGGTTDLPVVLQPSFVGRSFFVQGFALDAGGELLGLASATSGLELVVGP